MARKRKRGRKGKGQFKPGFDPRRHVFTKEECQRGFLAALDTCSNDWNRLAWFLRKIRSYFRHKKGETHGEAQERHFGIPLDAPW